MGFKLVICSGANGHRHGLSGALVAVFWLSVHDGMHSLVLLQNKVSLLFNAGNHRNGAHLVQLTKCELDALGWFCDDYTDG